MEEKSVRIKVRDGAVISDENITFKTKKELIAILRQKFKEVNIRNRKVSLVVEKLFADSSNDFECVKINGEYWFLLSKIPYLAMIESLCGGLARFYAIYITK